MLPSQLQYKDVITRILPGFLFSVILTFIILFFFFPEANLSSWFRVELKEFLLIILPFTLAVSYAVGAAMGTVHFVLIQIAYCHRLQNKSDGWSWMYKCTYCLFRRLFALHKYSIEEDPRIEPLRSTKTGYYINLQKKVEEIQGVDLNKFREQVHIRVNTSPYHQVYESCDNYNKTRSSSLAVAEIQRYSILMEFNAQLSIIFSLCLLGCTIAAFFPLLPFIKTPVWFYKNWAYWLFLGLIFYYFTRKCANKSVRDWKNKCSMIYNTFYILATSKDLTTGGEKSGSSLEN